MTQYSQERTSRPLLPEALGCVWPDWQFHSPLDVFVVLISMLIIYESATGYEETGAQGASVAYASSTE